MTNTAAAASPPSQWLHQTFFRDTGRIKCRERYGRTLHIQDIATSIGGSGSGPVLIPDGPFLRKYLRLIEGLLGDDAADADDAGGTNSRSCAVVLLESAFELADYRNATDCAIINEDDDDDAARTTIRPEAAAPNERSRVRQMVERYGPSPIQTDAAEKSRGVVLPFPDLSYRHADASFGDDEFVTLQLARSTVEDRSRRAVLRAGRIFRDATAAEAEGKDRCQRNIILLTDDTAIRQEIASTSNATSSSILSLTCLELIEYLHSNGICMQSEDQKQSSIDLAARCEEEYKQRNAAKQSLAFGGTTTSGGGRVPYLSETEVAAGLKSGKYYRGKLDVTKANIREAYVSISASNGGNQFSKTTTKYYVNDQLGNFNRALHNDSVIIEPLPEAQWGRPVGRRRLVHVQKYSDDENEEEDINVENEGPTVPSARVVALCGEIMRRQYVATAQPSSNRTGDDSAVLVVPMDIRVPKIRIKTRLGIDRISNKRILVEVDCWEVGSSYPNGHIVKAIGDIGNLETEISCLLIEHGIDLPPFSKSALACLPSIEGATWHIPADEVAKRRDLRNHRIFSVDPPGCEDIDDTMSAHTLPNGDIEIGVHIADVTHFVPHNSALDREARARGTTFYLVDRRFDMLPSLLSSDLCSLHGNVDRLAVSVIWTMSPDLEQVRSCWCGRSVIYNCAAMTYDQAHNILHDMPPDDLTKPSPPPLTAGAPVNTDLVPALKTDLAILTRLARKLRKKREDYGGAVDLSSGDRGSELKFVLDSIGNPVKVSAKKEMEIHHTIAEMMIFANGYVASRIYQSFPGIALLRIHSFVEESRFEELKSTLKSAGISFNGRSNKALAKTLRDAKLGGGGAIIDSLLQSLATRAMSEAQYICSGAQEGDVSFSHYGLGIDKYTHFTSPIRRYADVVVHRELLSAVSDMHRPATTPDTKVDRAILESLPDSQTMTVLGKSEDDDELDDDALLDSLIEGASELALEANKTKQASLSDNECNHEQLDESKVIAELYDTSQVVRICERLNHMNRVAKLSSMDCQRLFLSLYLQNNTEVTSAVVLSTRVNGLIVYVPKFDLKGAIFLCDKDGNLQIHPTIIGLAADTGLPPTSGFRILEGCRLIPAGKCILDGERLDINVEGSNTPCSFQPLDIVTVQLSCDVADTVARVPPPRIHLIDMGQKAVSRAATATRQEGKVAVTAKAIEDNRFGSAADARCTADRDGATAHDVQDISASLFQVLSSIKIEAKLHTPLRYTNGGKASRAKGRVTTFPGRVVFGEFKNPDTLRAEQDAAAQAASEAAAQRRNVHVHAVQGDYDATKQLEREATARMQRLAAEKRHARRRKAG